MKRALAQVHIYEAVVLLPGNRYYKENGPTHSTDSDSWHHSLRSCTSVPSSLLMQIYEMKTDFTVSYNRSEMQETHALSVLIGIQVMPARAMLISLKSLMLK